MCFGYFGDCRPFESCVTEDGCSDLPSLIGNKVEGGKKGKDAVRFEAEEGDDVTVKPKIELLLRTTEP
jgi:hypothetical protein